ncbi:hypothetical protein KAU34_06710, partial [candidate division WOR-3 bacterium]|nr:hypothetical protein [candidate division WOR-3 bacterium]
MTRAEIEELRGDILLRVNKLIPILYRIFEVNFALETDFDKRTIVKFVDYSKNFEDGLLESYIENIKQTELEALKKGYKILDKTQIYPLFSTTEKIRNLLSRKIEKHKIKSWGINAPVYNFALERIIDTIKRFPERPRIYFKDFEWENVQSTERELVVPGFTKTSLKFIEDEAKPLYKINEILNRFKHDCIEEDEINEYINVNAEIYGNIKSLTTHKLIINKVDRYVESSFPDSKTVIN